MHGTRGSASRQIVQNCRTGTICAQTERRLIILGVALCGGGVLLALAGEARRRYDSDFLAVARKTTGTLVSAESPHFVMRIELPQGVTDIPFRAQGWGGQSVGTTYDLLYDPRRPEHWEIESWFNPNSGRNMIRVAALMAVVGLALLAVARYSRRRNRRPFWQ